ncbi:hypothetical protein KM043_000074, partial [Ampulex compressa]
GRVAHGGVTPDPAAGVAPSRGEQSTAKQVARNLSGFRRECSVPPARAPACIAGRAWTVARLHQ